MRKLIITTAGYLGLALMWVPVFLLWRLDIPVIRDIGAPFPILPIGTLDGFLGPLVVCVLAYGLLGLIIGSVQRVKRA